MEYAILFSPSKGFWDDNYGWQSSPIEATRFPLKVPLQVSFKSTRDVKLVPAISVSKTTYDNVRDWLFENLAEGIDISESDGNVCQFVSSKMEFDAYHDEKSRFFYFIPRSEYLKLEKAPLVAPALFGGNNFNRSFKPSRHYKCNSKR